MVTQASAVDASMESVEPQNGQSLRDTTNAAIARPPDADAISAEQVVTAAVPQKVPPTAVRSPYYSLRQDWARAPGVVYAEICSPPHLLLTSFCPPALLLS
eukprot:3948216-Prymnesium_polylepis.1